MLSVKCKAGIMKDKFQEIQPEDFAGLFEEACLDGFRPLETQT